jgi:formamidopyrimidine-DNA glycosylase
LWTDGAPEAHPLLRALGPEPLSAAFNAVYLHGLAVKRSSPVKTLLMDSQAVVGVGNIYANEALFAAGVRPGRPARDVSLPEFERITACVKEVLQQAIAQGGTTLRDFLNAQGKPGYFQQQLWVYGRSGEACRRCGALIEPLRIAQRSSFYCPVCQLL